MVMNAYINFVQCPHNLRETEGREPLQAALFDICKLVDRGSEGERGPLSCVETAKL